MSVSYSKELLPEYVLRTSYGPLYNAKVRSSPTFLGRCNAMGRPLPMS